MARPYVMRARAETVEARRETVLAAAYDLFTTANLDDITFEAVAERAGVSLKTVVRQFKTKDEMLLACAQSGSSLEDRKREVPSGDVAAVVRVLAGRYDELLDLVPRMNVLEERIEAAAIARQQAIAGHQEWLATAFARWLPAAGPVRRRRLMALYGATEVYTWWMWRRRLGLSRAHAAAAMQEMLDALVTRWSEEKESTS